MAAVIERGKVYVGTSGGFLSFVSGKFMVGGSVIGVDFGEVGL